MSEVKNNELKRLSEFANPNAGRSYVKIDDVLGLDLVIHDVEFRQGDYGEYAVFTAEDVTGGIRTIASGARVVVEALHNAVDSKALPIVARFAKDGRKTIIL